MLSQTPYDIRISKKKPPELRPPSDTYAKNACVREKKKVIIIKIRESKK